MIAKTLPTVWPPGPPAGPPACSTMQGGGTLGLWLQIVVASCDSLSRLRGRSDLTTDGGECATLACQTTHMHGGA